MSKRRLLVTGARGFVGSILTEAADAAGFDPVGFTDPETTQPADLRDARAVERAITHAQPDAVIHLAAIAAPRQAKNDPHLAWQVNVMGTLHLAQAVLSHAPAARFIFAGSSEAYGAALNRDAVPIRETAALEPMSPYGATKAAADVMLRQMAHDGLRATIFRPFNHTGPGQQPAYVVPAFAHQIAEIEAGRQAPVLKVGNLDACRDFLDVRDVARAYLMAAGRDDLENGETFNLSTGTPVQIKELLAMLTGLARVPVSVETDPDRFAPNTIPRMSGDPSLARERLGWVPKIPLERTLADILDRFRRQVAV
ncbi:GDP-mannose 4,6-dehydratase [uncultured Rhizobium sp.]|uniref:GDP-mannose 4,6-dehydratase n=1 Tax=uncultured Rhizobium sp. TaxID=155567 RepID=UPI001AD4F5AD|nr:GDP-mannose 4,6-dehydratase [uncultured Rhizobium sp.]MBN9034311.1 GDP-mannose 4,6-dehydratase [Hyphomicrobiales bacterium]